MPIEYGCQQRFLISFEKIFAKKVQQKSLEKFLVSRDFLLHAEAACPKESWWTTAKLRGA
jgi:hypothetical protein